MKKTLLSVFLALLLLWTLPAAHAEDSFTLDIDLLNLDSLNSDAYVAQALSSSAQGIRVRKYISDSTELAASTRLVLKRMDSGAIVFDRDYGFQSGVFDSGLIYLPYAGEGTTPYLVTLYLGGYVYALPFMHLQSRLSYNGSCTVGVRLRDLDAALSNDWFMGTMVDLDALRSSGGMSVDLCASNSYLIGTAYLRMSGSSLCVDLSFTPSAHVEVSEQSLYVVTDCRSFSSAPALSVGQWVDVGSASSALIYLPMQLSYDPAGLPSFRYNASSASVQRQVELWNENRTSHAGSSSDESRKEFSPFDEPASDVGWAGNTWDDAWDNDGWDNDGWDADYGWDDGWDSDASGWE